RDPLACALGPRRARARRDLGHHGNDPDLPAAQPGVERKRRGDSARRPPREGRTDSGGVFLRSRFGVGSMAVLRREFLASLYGGLPAPALPPGAASADTPGADPSDRNDLWASRLPFSPPSSPGDS